MSAEQREWDRFRAHLDDQLARGEITEDEYGDRVAAFYVEQDLALRQASRTTIAGVALGSGLCFLATAAWFAILAGGIWVLWALGVPGWAYPVWLLVYVLVLPALSQGMRR